MAPRDLILNCICVIPSEYPRMNNAPNRELPIDPDCFVSNVYTNTNHESAVCLQLMSEEKELLHADEQHPPNSNQADCNEPPILFPELKSFKGKHHKKLIFAHLNVNSLRNKFIEIAPILANGYCDILALSETKLDESFSSSVFHVRDFNLLRKDRNGNGGGMAFYVRSSLPHRVRDDMYTNQTFVEYIVLETCLKGEKIFFISVYKPPDVSNECLSSFLETVCTMCLRECKSIYIMGDLNVNFNCKPHALSEITSILNVKNIIKGSTCFKNPDCPTLLDVILTNTPNRIAETINITTGISDFHNYVGAATKMGAPQLFPKTINYRSMKNFDENMFINDVKQAPFGVAEIFDDVEDKMWYFEKLFHDLIERNAPTKTKKIKPNQIPYMHGQLRKAINVKAMLKRKYYKSRSSGTWSKYRKQRNYVTKLKRQAKQEYFDKHCNRVGKDNEKSFWKTVKPFFSQSLLSNPNISISHNESIVSEPNTVCNLLNDFFIDVADSLGENLNLHKLSLSELRNHFSSHPSITFIKSSIINKENFNFRSITAETIVKKCSSLKLSKAPGYDRISSKFIKLASNGICSILTHIINHCLESSTFPHSLKKAVVTPVFKKSDPLEKSNYRPVSVLTGIAKIFEAVICDQMTMHFDTFLSSSLAAYRKSYSCEDVLLKSIEDWREALDRSHFVGCMSMDLSKAFDSLPHNLLLAKLLTYGMSECAVELIRSYLTDRPQCVKIGNDYSLWKAMKRGVPQGSLTGPLLFNIFLNDFVLYMQNFCDIYNYADDNSICYRHENLGVVKGNIERCCKKAITWFSNNNMQANPKKFQCMVLQRQSKTCNISFKIDNEVILPSDNIKILGVHLDKDLSFTKHVSNLCKITSRQVNILGRLTGQLNYESKLKILHSFVLSNFNYCSLVYHESGSRNEGKMEKILERALRAVFNDFRSSYSELLKQASLDTLYSNRCKRLIEHVYKVINNLSPLFSSDYYEIKKLNYAMRKQLLVRQPNFQTVRYGKNSLKYRASKLWNETPNRITNETDYKAFKLALGKHHF